MGDWLHPWRLGRGHDDADRRPTHLLLDGGRLCVPDAAAGRFLNAYAIAVVQQRRPCVVELRTPVFRLFMDLDIKTAAGAALDVDAAVRVIQGRVAAFFDVEQPRCVVCVSPPAALDDGAVKQGRHLHWPDVRVAPATALALRELVVGDLDLALPEIGRAHV